MVLRSDAFWLVLKTFIHGITTGYLLFACIPME